MNTCDVCKHWELDEDKYISKSILTGECKNNKFVYDRDCPIDGLRYWDYEGYSAGFETGPKFGCIHWEKI